MERLTYNTGVMLIARPGNVQPAAMKKAPSSISDPATRRARSPLTGKAIPSLRKPKAGKAVRCTQAERLAKTRARIIAATVAYIDERGLTQTSLQQVAKSAGVTVGAVQHHFASKAELLTAVVADNFQQLPRQLRELTYAARSLEERIGMFVDACWDFCNAPYYQASLQIMLDMRKEEKHPQAAQENFEPWINQTLGHIAEEGFDIWQQMFHDLRFNEEEHFDMLLYIFSSLSGSALLSRISQHPARVESDLRELKKLLLLRFNAAR
jgi:AcrR family transcriptional regulator